MIVVYNYFRLILLINIKNMKLKEAFNSPGEDKGETISGTDKPIEIDIEKTEELPGKGSKVECNINGERVTGVIFNSEISGGQMVGILLDENIGSNYLNGFGTTLGIELLNDPEKIKKIGEVSDEELDEILTKVNGLSQIVNKNVEFEIDGIKENVNCKVVDLATEEYDKAFKNADFFVKSAEIEARQAIEEENVETGLDATKNVANIGDWIVTNPGGEQYVISKEKFSQLYKEKENEEGSFVSAGKPVKAIRTEKNIVFTAPWGEEQSVKAGGYVIENNEERYGIDEQVFRDTYKEFEK